MHLSDFIQKSVKISIVRSIFIVAELMKHSIKYLFTRKEIPVPIWPPQPQLNLSTSSYVQAQKRWIGWTTNLKFWMRAINMKNFMPKGSRYWSPYQNSERILTFHFLFRIIGCTCLATFSRIFLASSSPILLRGLISQTLLRSSRSI